MNYRKNSAARLLWLAILGCILLGGSASAQLFQTVVGGGAAETGRGGTIPLPAGAGYISVGHTGSFISAADFYVVQTNLAGAAVMTCTYNFGGNDFGYDIHRCTNGDYVVTGTTSAAGTNDMIIMRITAAGAVVWARRIGGTATQEEGRDVLEASNGDIIAAGWANGTTAGNRDGLVVRLTGAGALVFSRTFAPSVTPNLDDYFNGIWQAANGELLACGSTNSLGGAYQGWVTRLTGAGGVAWSRHIGGPNSNEVFNSVIELLVAPQTGNIIAVGSTTGVPGDPLDFYVIRITGAGGFLMDISGGSAAGREEMFQVRENQTMNPGRLILAGSMNPGPNGGEDGYAVEMTAAFACPVGKFWSRAYGGTNTDRLYSAQEVPTNCIQGYIMCGQTSTFVVAPDPQQHYLIKTDNIGISGCNEIAPADRCTQPNFVLTINTLASITYPAPVSVNPARTCPIVSTVLCSTPCPPPVKENLSGTGSVMEAIADIFPNPITTGGTFEMPYLLSSDDEASIMVSDMSGRIVYEGTRELSAGAGSLTIGTDGWASGVYVVKVDIGGGSRTQRVMVLEK